MKICMQNTKRIDCNVAIWWLDDLAEMILFMMINKKKFRKSTTCETFVYSIALLCYLSIYGSVPSTVAASRFAFSRSCVVSAVGSP